MSIPLLYALGLRLENAQAFLGRAIDEGRLPELPSEAEELLVTVLQLHGNIIAGTDEGRQLLANAEAYARSGADSATLRQKTQQVIAAVSTHTELFEAETIAVVAELADGMGFGPREERNSEAAKTATSNLLKATFGVAAFSSLAAVTPGIEASVPGQLVADLTTQVVNAAWTFVSTHVHLLREFAAAAGPDFNWLRMACDAVSHVARRKR